MRKINVILIITLLSIICTFCKAPKAKYFPDISTTTSPEGTAIFKADSASIAQNYTIPEWFRDAKLGIFIHWGVYSVPAYGSEWYSRNMYIDGSEVNKYHKDKYGDLTEFGYKDFIPIFQGKKFNAKEWAKIIKESGAKYVVPVAEHHDGFAMYNSSFNNWNSVKMGPKRDIIGELAEAIKEEGLIFGLSSHRAENAWFYNGGMETPSDVMDMSITLYGERLARPGGKGMTAWCGENEGSNEKSRKEWLQHTYELIDKYKPQLMWFDWTVGKYPFQPTFYKFMAYYYNNAIDWDKEVVINTKVGFGNNIQVFDIERGKSDKILDYPWQTDTSIGKISWSYTPNEENKTPNHIIDDLVDIVSKNGNLLLNIGPREDGTITEEQEFVLRELGKWLKINGEGIYNTRPWIVCSEGDSKGNYGYMTDGKSTKYTEKDIRYTTHNNIIYAIALEWKDKGEIYLNTFSSNIAKDIKIEDISLLGSDEKVDWKITDKGINIKFPTIKPTEYAHVFKIKTI